MNWKLIRIIDTYLGIPLLLALSLARRFGRHPASPSVGVKRILLIKFWGIGNIFMIIPSILALRKAYPDAILDFLTLESNRQALEISGAADTIVTIDTGTIPRFISTWQRAVSRLKHNDYDIIVDFEQFARFSALVANQVGAREIIGFATRGQHRSYLYTHAIPYDNTIHITRSFFALAIAAGTANIPFPTKISLPGIEGLQKRGREILAESGIGADEVCVVMHVGTSDNFRERRWLPERYAALADLLTSRFQVRVIFTGLAEESFLIREVFRHLRAQEAVADLSGRLQFDDYFALVAATDLVISADTAAVHLASALDIPVVGLYGPNTPTLYGPWGSNGIAVYPQFDCSPCITNFNAKHHACRHPAGRGACMRAIEVEDVFTAIQQHYFSPTAPCRLKKLGGD